ncbi:hypothetical protein B0H11DRAFT_2198871 [Mycena galericulata]|nr:hypothetical protein B0H11DRAFT_2198871 [Mycena galericulata]
MAEAKERAPGWTGEEAEGRREGVAGGRRVPCRRRGHKPESRDGGGDPGGRRRTATTAVTFLEKRKVVKVTAAAVVSYAPARQVHSAGSGATGIEEGLDPSLSVHTVPIHLARGDAHRVLRRFESYLGKPTNRSDTQDNGGRAYGLYDLSDMAASPMRVLLRALTTALNGRRLKISTNGDWLRRLRSFELWRWCQAKHAEDAKHGERTWHRGANGAGRSSARSSGSMGLKTSPGLGWKFEHIQMHKEQISEESVRQINLPRSSDTNEGAGRRRTLVESPTRTCIGPWLSFKLLADSVALGSSWSFLSES